MGETRVLTEIESHTAWFHLTPNTGASPRPGSHRDPRYWGYSETGPLMVCLTDVDADKPALILLQDLQVTMGRKANCIWIGHQ